jgi:hypothetical protein
LLPRWLDRLRYVRGYFAVGSDYREKHGRSGVRAQSRYVLGKLRGRS